MKIRSIRKNSIAEQNGFQAGDDVLSINGYPVHDDIDVMFYGSDDIVEYCISRNDSEYIVELHAGEDEGIEFEPIHYMACGSNCIFCFVDQNPPGMRKTIYFKDEDYRLSFLYGSYVTLTRLKENHLQRIIEQRLSPLYVSVHAVDPDVRKSMLGLNHDDRLMEKIDRLVDEGIVLH